MCEIIHNSRIIYQICSKFDAEISHCTPSKHLKFQLDWSMCLQVPAILLSVRKEEQKEKNEDIFWKFDCLYLGNGWSYFQIFFKFKMWLPLSGGHLNCKFYAFWIGATYA